MHCLNFWSAWTHLIQVHWLTANSACTEIRLIQPFSSNSRVIQCLLHSLLAMNHPECFCYSVQIGNRSAMFLSFNSKRSNSSCRRARKRLLLTLCIRGIRFTFTHDHRTRLKRNNWSFHKVCTNWQWTGAKCSFSQNSLSFSHCSFSVRECTEKFDPNSRGIGIQIFKRRNSSASWRLHMFWI